MRVLLVEDNDVERRVVVELLREVAAGSVEVEAVARLGTAEEAVRRTPPDVVILDLNLADAGGLEGLRRLLAIRPDLPVVVVTGSRDEALALEAAREGAQDYLVKGQFDGDTLLRVARYAFERTQQDRALREQEALFRPPADGLAEGLVVADLEGRIRYVNPRLEAITGFTSRELIGQLAEELLMPPEDREVFRGRLAARARGVAETYTTQMLRRDGSRYWARIQASPRHDTEGRVAGVVAAFQDVTAALQTEEALRDHERRLRMMLEQLPAILWTVDVGLRVTSAAGSGLRAIGLAAAQIEERSLFEVFPEPRDHDFLAARHRAALAGESVSYETKWHGRVFQTVIEPLRSPRGTVEGAIGLAIDVTPRVEAERARQAAEERLREVVRQSPVVMYTAAVRSPWKMTWISDNLEQVLGYRPRSVLADPETWLGSIHPDDRDGFRTARERLSASNSISIEYRVRARDGAYRWVRDETTLAKSGGGGAPEVVGAITDVTERKLLEEQFRQAQKMEAIGRLAGGVAHDFNNLLTAIGGYAELLALELESESARQDVAEIRRAVDRAATLTRQLLAFSRRQMLQPQALAVNEVVADMEKMLRRVIGEDVQLRLELGEGLGAVRADPGQLEQVVLNLAVNARDAMPNGGVLTLATAAEELKATIAFEDVAMPPGSYVVLSVEDQGHGMDRETRERAFEPFFTTRPGGTGLGLATVYGIVKQSEGFVFVDSAPGEGARFRIYLHEVAAEPEERIKAPPESGDLRGDEAILVVEDDAAVRNLVVQSLRDHGYQVWEAASAEEALEVTRGESPNLLISDVILPHMSGPELRERLLTRYDELPCLFISGYTARFAAGDLGKGVQFLQKPFSPLELVRRARRILDGKDGHSGERPALGE